MSFVGVEFLHRGGAGALIKYWWGIREINRGPIPHQRQLSSNEVLLTACSIALVCVRPVLSQLCAVPRPIMRSVAALCLALLVVAAVVLSSKSTDAFLVPSGTCCRRAGGAKLPTSSPLIPQRGNSASANSNPVVLSAGFFGGGGGGGNNESSQDKQQRAPGDLISQKRRAQLGINADEDEYDLYYALDQNTDPIITKVIAGSFILVMIALLVYGVVIPSLTVYDEGVCR